MPTPRISRVTSKHAMRIPTVGPHIVTRTARPVTRTAPYTYDPNETDAQFNSLTPDQLSHYFDTQPGEPDFAESNEPNPLKPGESPPY